MIIQCPACGARAKLPDSKEGAKVRCVECSRVYLALARGTASPGRSRSNPALPIGIGAGVIALVLVLLMVRGGDDQAAAPKLPDVPEREFGGAPVDQSGWNSVLVVHTRKLHELAASGDQFELQNSISLPHVWARLQLPEGEEVPLSVDAAGYAELDGDAVDAQRSQVLEALLSKEPANLVGTWKPFDGSVISQTDTTAIVRLALEPRSPEFGEGTRNIEWRLVLDGARWKAWYWERWISPEEEKQERVRQKRSYEQLTLSDGSIVIEGEPKPIEYMDETPLEQRQRIDALIVKLIDLELPAKELTRVKAELQLEGKHAIPPLLTLFYHQSQAGFPDMDAAVQAQLVHQMLSDLTGYVTSFKAHDALGATQERRDSGVRQWYGWYNKHFKKFEERVEETDGLEEQIEFKSERERREYEKYKLLIEQEEANKNPNRKPDEKP
jgi:predicted Zn finger-like uncharacterized protein